MRSIREQGRAEARREDMLEVAARLVDEARLDALRRLEDLDELEAQVMRLLEDCARANGSGDGI